MMRSPADLVRSDAPGEEPCADVVQLGRGAKGIRGTVVQVGAQTGAVPECVAAAELERLLLEIGFVEGAAIEILHEGFIRGDPIAVRLDDMRVALRRKEADAILVRVTGGNTSAAGPGN
jgi:ferrous iron transport protein A